MSLKAKYNNVAGGYATASDQFGSISLSHEAAINQILNSNLDATPHIKILDLGVGDGAFLQKLQKHFKKSQFTGIDISAEMLKHAKAALPSITTIETSATEASQLLPHHSQDLLLAHFINAYIPIDKLFTQASLLASPNGCFSFITTTYDSFLNGQQQISEFSTKKSILSRIVKRFYKNVLKNTTVAANKDELIQTFAKYQFEIIDHQRLSIPIALNNINEGMVFGIQGTWFLNGLPYCILPKKFIQWIVKLVVCKIITFPYKDTHLIDIILAKRIIK